MSDLEGWVTALKGGENIELKPWEQVQVLEHLAAGTDDEVEVAAALLTGPIPAYRLEEIYALAVGAANEGIALALLDAGSVGGLLSDAAQNGMPRLCQALIAAGARMNRLYQAAPAPVHLAARSARPDETVRAFVDAGCDVTVRTPQGEHVWDLTDEALGDWVRAQVGVRGPSWFRQAQKDGVDHYLFVDEDVMFGFNPNDIQTPIWTGDESEGFGWPNTAAQAIDMLEDNRRLRFDVEWFLPFLDKLAADDDFSLDDLPSDAGAPRRRPSWR